MLLVFGGVGPGQVFANDVYWTDKEAYTICRGSFDGSEPPTVLLSPADGLGIPQGIGLDIDGGKMYFADNQLDKISRANLDGSAMEDLVTGGMTFPVDLELDTGAGKMYWTDTTQGEIRRADLGGGNVEVLYTGLNQPYFFELDTAGGKIYWAENDNTVVHVSEMDGSGHIGTLDVGQIRIRDVGLDATGNMIYWGDRGSSTVERANLDGTGGEVLFSGSALDRPHGMALDLADDMIYWTDTTKGSINRGAFDGSGSVDVLYTGLTSPWDIEIVPEPSTLALLIAGFASVFRTATRRRRR